jgi:hypothetical protein
VSHAISRLGNTRDKSDVSIGVSDRSFAEADSRPASLVIIKQSGAKCEIPQASTTIGMIEAEQIMHRHGLRLREVKLVSRNKAVARWKAGDLGWRRVA